MLQSAILKVELVDEATGEVTNKEINVLDALAAAIEVKPKRSSSSSSRTKLIEDDTPKLILEDNKYSLTTGALQLIGVEPGGEDKLDIQYQKIGKLEYPLIGKPEAYDTKGGNKITKSGTVRFSGNKHDQLSEFGTEFILVKHPNSDSLFILTQDGQVPEGNASLDSLKKKNTKKSSTKEKVEEPDPDIEHPEPEDTPEVDNLNTLLQDEDNKDFDASDFTL